MALMLPILVITPLLGIPGIIGIFSRRNNTILSILFLGILFAWLGFNYIPSGNSDLVRYFDIVNQYRNNDFHYFLNSLENSSDKFFFVQKFLFYIISRFPTNQFLPAITSFICFSIGFYALNKIHIIYTTSYKSFLLSIILFLTMLRLDVVSGNIRNITAAAIVFLALFGTTILKWNKYIEILLFIVASSMHIGVLPIILLKLLYDGFISLKKLKIITFFSILVFTIVLGIVIIRIGLWDILITKINQYSAGGIVGESDWFLVLSNSPSFIFYRYGIIFVSAFAIAVSLFISQTNQHLEIKKISNFMMLVSLVTIVVSSQPGSTFLRYFYFLMYILPAMLPFILKLFKNNYLLHLMVIMTILFIILFFGYYQYYYLNYNINFANFVNRTLLFPIYYYGMGVDIY